jgi:hypothetical protein
LIPAVPSLESTENNIWLSNIKWRMEIRTSQELMDLYTEPDMSEIRKGKITVVRTCGKNARRKNCEESV